MSDIFLDTNILVYAVDKDAGERHTRAKAILKPFYADQAPPIVSAQVLHEFTNRLYRWQLPDEKIAILVEPMRYWRVIPNDWALFEDGLKLKQRYQVSFWDSLILAAAIRAGAREIWSEDFNSGQSYDGVRVINPLMDR